MESEAVRSYATRDGRAPRCSIVANSRHLLLRYQLSLCAESTNASHRWLAGTSCQLDQDDTDIVAKRVEDFAARNEDPKKFKFLK
jgi:hypothetical protein